VSDSVSTEPVREGSHATSIAPAEVLDDCAWFPFRLDLSRGEATFTRTTRNELAAQPFLDIRWDRSRAPACVFPIETLRSAPEIARAPGFIWHTSFCCSTLIADCLEWPGLSLSLKEPIALVDLAFARHGRDRRADAALTSGVVRLLGRPFDPGALTLIKPSNAANPSIGALSAAAGPSLFLYSSLRRFLLAVARGGEKRRFFARTLVRQRAQTPGALLPVRDLEQFTDMQAAAVAWRLQMQEFRAAAARLGPARAMLLDAEAFLRDPADVLARLDGFFAIGLGSARIAEIVAGPKTRRNAKVPSKTFDRLAEVRALDEMKRLLGADLEALEAWSAGVTGDPHPVVA
jgi:hypothetical protein